MCAILKRFHPTSLFALHLTLWAFSSLCRYTTGNCHSEVGFFFPFFIFQCIFTNIFSAPPAVWWACYWEMKSGWSIKVPCKITSLCFITSHHITYVHILRTKAGKTQTKCLCSFNFFPLHSLNLSSFVHMRNTLERTEALPWLGYWFPHRLRLACPVTLRLSTCLSGPPVICYHPEEQWC